APTAELRPVDGQSAGWVGALSSRWTKIAAARARGVTPGETSGEGDRVAAARNLVPPLIVTLTATTEDGRALAPTIGPTPPPDVTLGETSGARAARRRRPTNAHAVSLATKERLTAARNGPFLRRFERPAVQTTKERAVLRRSANVVGP